MAKIRVFISGQNQHTNKLFSLAIGSAQKNVSKETLKQPTKLRAG